MSSYLRHQMSENNGNVIHVKPKSFAASSKYNFGKRIINVATVAIYITFLTKFPLKSDYVTPWHRTH